MSGFSYIPCNDFHMGVVICQAFIVIIEDFHIIETTMHSKLQDKLYRKKGCYQQPF